MGMQVTGFTITLPLDGTIPTISFDFVGVHWLRGADAAGSGSLTDITPVTYANTSPITAQAGRFMVQTAGTATYTGSTVNVSSVAFEPQHSFQQITSPSGIGGVLQHRLTRQNGPSIQGNFNTYLEDVSWWTKKEAKTDLLVLYQIGDTAGKSILLEAATCQVIDPERVDGNGIAEINVTWKGRRDGDQDVGTGAALTIPPEAAPIVFTCRPLTRAQRRLVRAQANIESEYELAFRFGVVQVRNLPSVGGGGVLRVEAPTRSRPGDPITEDGMDSLGLADDDEQEIGMVIRTKSFLALGVPLSCPQLASSVRAYSVVVVRHAERKKDSSTPKADESP
jgi:hypothetical protein